MASHPPEDKSPDPLAPLLARLNRLEEKACFSDDLVEALNAQVAEQQAQIALLARELRRLRSQQAGGDEPGTRSLRDELPPHY